MNPPKKILLTSLSQLDAMNYAFWASTENEKLSSQALKSPEIIDAAPPSEANVIANEVVAESKETPPSTV